MAETSRDDAFIITHPHEKVKLFHLIF